MGVHKRGESWNAVWTEGRKRRTLAFKTKRYGTSARAERAARAFHAARVQEEDFIRKGLVRPEDVRVSRHASMPIDQPDAETTTPASVVGHYRAVLVRRGLTDKYIKQTLAEVRAALGGFSTISEIDRESVQARIDALAGEKSPRAYNGLLKSARAVTRWAATPGIGYLASDPLAGLELKRDLSDVNPPRPLDDKEAARLLAIKSPRVGLYRFRMLTGIRGAETQRLEASMIDGDLIRLPARIQKVQEFRKRKCDAVLPLAASIELPMRAGPLWPQRVERKAWRRDLAAAGIDLDRGPVSLRYTFNQLMMRAGVAHDERCWLMRHWEGMTDSCYSNFEDPVLIGRMRDSLAKVESHLAAASKGQKVAC